MGEDTVWLSSRRGRAGTIAAATDEVRSLSAHSLEDRSGISQVRGAEGRTTQLRSIKVLEGGKSSMHAIPAERGDQI